MEEQEKHERQRKRGTNTAETKESDRQRSD